MSIHALCTESFECSGLEDQSRALYKLAKGEIISLALHKIEVIWPVQASKASVGLLAFSQHDLLMVH